MTIRLLLVLALHTEGETAFLEYFQHRSVVGQHPRDQLLEPRFEGNRGEMVHQCSADTLPLDL